ncbi:Alpha-D-kanosaminyltransferase [Mycobacteroides salmoniphilum]|uniref:Alpha-D-kanosaminyltransferase n=1 Tax=Mycobacteroides salmoniphilum TaxID=404941 RepID=A0A4R8S4E3_9MYCO|nr:glycosyltransferase [Mycobacteroides salmoniphilum]TDZ79894.1 Alpha-D-kanosaminyltransferase [Mycobacteroides salmoniphilum]
MHIALFTDLHPESLGGAQISVARQRHGLERLGHKVTVFTAPLAHTVDPDPNVVEVKPVPFVAEAMRKLGKHDDFTFVWPGTANRELIDRELRARGPIDIIHSQGDLGVCIAGVEAARRNGIPVVQTKHTRYDVYFEKASPNPLLLAWIFSQMQERHLPRDFHLTTVQESAASRRAWQLMMAQAQAVDHEITPTTHFAQALTERGLRRPISVVSNGVDDELVDIAREAADDKPTDDEPLRLIWCGRLSPEKRVLEAVKAATQVKNCVMDIYGDGHLEHAIKKYVDSHGASNRIRLRGRVSQDSCLAAMGASSALLFTSYGFDTQGLVLLEAISMSTPVIFCDEILGESVPDGGGLVTENESVEAIAAAIRALADDRDKLRQMTEVVAAHQDEPRQSLQTEKIVAIYNDVLKKANA